MPVQCGPQPSPLDRPVGAVTAGDPVIAAAADKLNGGLVVAVKGVGGYRLSCDATATAVTLTTSGVKRRGQHEPFAVMVRRNLDVARDLFKLG